VAILGIALAGCDTSGLSTGIEGTGSRAETVAAVSRGPIQSADGVDIKVNDTTWSAAAAKITIDGAGAELLDLRRGTVVTVQGERTALDRARASAIDTTTTLRGPIRSLDSPTGHLDVMGQTVLGDESTVLEISGGSLDSLYVGQVVEVSGFVAASGEIRATRISTTVRSGGLPWMVSGIITGSDPGLSRFEINDLAVSYAPTLLTGLPLGTLDVGQSVVVSGFALDGDDVLLADRIAPYTEALPPIASGDAVVSGIVYRIEADGVFHVSGQRVVPAIGAAVPGTIVEGSYVRAAGALNSGVLLATEIFVVGSGRTYMLDGPIEAIDIASRTFRILGVQLFVNEWTRFGRRTSLSDFAVGDIVSVWAHANGFAGSFQQPWPNHATYGIEAAWFSSLSPPTGFTVQSVANFPVQVSSGTRFFLTYRAGDGDCYGADVISADEFWERASAPRPAGLTSIYEWGRFEGGMLFADEVWVCYP
jgi:hypothetical protein